MQPFLYHVLFLQQQRTFIGAFSSIGRESACSSVKSLKALGLGLSRDVILMFKNCKTYQDVIA